MTNSDKMRMTKQRRTILGLVPRLDTHPTVEEVFEAVKALLPNLSLGTVYRNLEMLSELGYIKKLNTSQNPMRFDGRTDPHSHVWCKNCGRVEDLEIPELRISPGEAKGFKVTGYSLDFTGLCPDCSRRANSEVDSRRPGYGERKSKDAGNSVRSAYLRQE